MHAVPVIPTNYGVGVTRFNTDTPLPSPCPDVFSNNHSYAFFTIDVLMDEVADGFTDENFIDRFEPINVSDDIDVLRYVSDANVIDILVNAPEVTEEIVSAVVAMDEA